MIDERSIEALLNRVDIVDVVSRHVELKRKGSIWQACCPFHNERTPSFIVNPTRNTWHCFGACSEGGNAISFLMKMCNMSFPEAVKELDGRAVLVLAGPETDEFKALGIEHFINVRTNVLATLKAFNAKLLK